VRTVHCVIQLNVTNSNRFLHLSERPNPASVFTRIRASKSRWSEWKLLLSLWVQCLMASDDCPLIFCYLKSTSGCPSILWISQLEYYFLCRLFTGYPKLKDFWNNDLPHFTKCFLNGPLLWVLWRTASTRDLCTALSRHSNVYGWLRTARNWGLVIVLPLNICANNVRLQNYETLNEKYYPHYFYPLVLYPIPSSNGTVTCR
jgi:hypothetical protein